MSRLRSYEPSFVSVFWLKEKNVHVRVFTSKWRSYMCLPWHTSLSWFSTVGINWKVSIVLYCHFFCQSERHAARTQIQVRKFVSTLLQLYIFITAVTDWCEQRLEKCIVFIMYVYSYKEKKEEKKHYHNINFGCDWGMIKKFFPSSQAFVNGLLRQKECLFSWRIKIIAKCKRWRDAFKLDTLVCRGSKTCTEIEETGDDLRQRRRKLEPMN